MNDDTAGRESKLAMRALWVAVFILRSLGFACLCMLAAWYGWVAFSLAFAALILVGGEVKVTRR
jgi:hypothetical protein